MAGEAPRTPDDLFQSLDRAFRAVAQAQQIYANMIEPALKVGEFLRRLDETIRSVADAQRQFQQGLDQVTNVTLAAMEQVTRLAQVMEQATTVARRVAGTIARYEEAAKQIAAAFWASVEREAKARGVTAQEFLEAVQSAAEIVEDPEELKQLQTVAAWNAFHAGEISIVDLIRALPPGLRPWPASVTGVPNNDFRPLLSGIIRRD